MALMNRRLAPGIDVVCLITALEHQFIRSSLVREVARLGGEIEGARPAERCRQGAAAAGGLPVSPLLEESKERSAMDMIYLIDKLESLAANAKRMPITGKAMIDSERLIEVVDQMRLSVPQSVQEATEVLEQRDSIINQSATDARRLRATAERESRMLVEESELVASAKRRADSIIQEAEEQARQLIAKAESNAVARRNGADEYAHEILLQLEQKLASTLETVRHGIGAVSAGEQPPLRERCLAVARSIRW